VSDEAAVIAVTAANSLTARWARSCTERGTVLSGLGVWPLLAALADPAGGAARDELAQAIGIPARAAPEAAAGLLGTLQGNRAVHTALGLWTAAAFAVRAEWLDRLTGITHGVLDPVPARARAALDAWAEKETGGLLRHVQVPVDERTRLVLASALTVRTEWERKFRPEWSALPEPWAGRQAAVLSREIDLGDVSIATGEGTPVTLATVRGGDDIDVVLALGEPGAPAGTVLATAVLAAGPTGGRRRGAVDLDDPRPGPGLSVVEVPAHSPEPTARLRTVAFTVNAEHDLLSQADLFGLRTASDCSTGHFPGIGGEVPLCVQGAAQNATASFSADGFVAAAVTTLSMAAASALRPPPATAKLLTAGFDRPFGFVAVDRSTGLVLVCGWVDRPDERPS
jgi:serine protease inhibitor